MQLLSLSTSLARPFFVAHSRSNPFAFGSYLALHRAACTGCVSQSLTRRATRKRAGSAMTSPTFDLRKWLWSKKGLSPRFNQPCLLLSVLILNVVRNYGFQDMLDAGTQLIIWKSITLGNTRSFLLEGRPIGVSEKCQCNRYHCSQYLL